MVPEECLWCFTDAAMIPQSHTRHEMERDVVSLQRLEELLTGEDGPDKETVAARLGGFAEQLYERYEDLFHRGDRDPVLTDIEAALRGEIERHFSPPPAREEWRASLDDDAGPSDEWRKSIPPDEPEDWRESLREED